MHVHQRRWLNDYIQVGSAYVTIPWLSNEYKTSVPSTKDFSLKINVLHGRTPGVVHWSDGQSSRGLCLNALHLRFSLHKLKGRFAWMSLSGSLERSPVEEGGGRRRSRWDSYKVGLTASCRRIYGGNLPAGSVKREPKLVCEYTDAEKAFKNRGRNPPSSHLHVEPLTDLCSILLC
jgi:hypothetical protein